MSITGSDFEARAIAYIVGVFDGEKGLASMVSHRGFEDTKAFVPGPLQANQMLDEGAVCGQIESDLLLTAHIRARRDRGARSVIFQDPWSECNDGALNEQANLIRASGNLHYVFDLDDLPDDPVSVIRRNAVSYQKIGYLCRLTRNQVLEALAGDGGEFGEIVANAISEIFISAFDDEAWLGAKVRMDKVLT